MTKIYKYPLAVLDAQEILVPQGAFVLSVQIQHHGGIVFWAMVDDEAGPERRTYRVFGTGQPIPDDLTNARNGSRYLGTVQDGVLVWHVFEQAGKKAA